MAFPDAQCVRKLNDALDNAEIYIKTHQAVSPLKDHPISDGAEALALSSFDLMADHTITTISASSDYEKCKQDIYLAYYVANLRAEKALHVSITKKYLDVKLDILRWTLVVQEYRRVLREEDKNKREAEREEMRSLREMHRREQEAIKQKAEYERELQLKKAAMKVSVSYAEQQKLLAYIKQLEAQIVAKDDEVRALTAAQLGRTGTVYVISNVGSFGEGVYKIGMTRRFDPQERIDELNEASTPFPFDVHAFIKAPDAPTLERELHEIFSAQKVNLVANINAREFYRVPLEQIREQVEKMGYTASWKMQADAIQFTQSEQLRQSGVTHLALPQDTNQSAAPITSNAPITDDNTVVDEANASYTIEQLIDLLSQQHIAFVDKRDKGGCLWIESTKKFDPILESFSLKGSRLTKASRVRHFNGNPGWYTH